MSCSKWAYEPEKCDYDYCVGDCDFCHKADDDGTEVTVEKIVRSVRWKGESHAIDRCRCTHRDDRK